MNEKLSLSINLRCLRSVTQLLFQENEVSSPEIYICTGTALK